MREKQAGATGRRGSILDLFLFFLLLLSILGIVLRWQERRLLESQTATENVRLLAVAEGIDPRVADCLQSGEMLYTVAGEEWGTVASVQRTATPISLISGGEIFYGYWDETVKCDLLVEINFPGTQNQGTVLWNGRQAVPLGQALMLFSERTSLKLKVLKILDFSGENGLFSPLSNSVVSFCTKSFRR